MVASRRCSLVIFIFVFFLSIEVLFAKPPRRGVTLPFVHRDSPNSPFHNPNHSHYTRVRTAISRSIARAKWLSSRKYGSGYGSVSELSVPETEIISAKGEYLMNVSIGTPSFPILAIADTGSDLIWTQCKPCSNCYEQNAPLFDPRKSSTYRPVSCSAAQCNSEASGFNPSCDDSNKCQYSVSYGDQSSSSGTIAAETLTLGSSKFPKTTFGCGFDNQGTFSPSGSGIIGLGNGPASLIGQLDKSIGGKFSYCLVPLSSTGTQSSQINFGENAVVSGDDVVSTPLKSGDSETFYNLNLEAITVGEKRVPFTSSSGFMEAYDQGNIIIDSGTTLLILPQNFYDALTSEIQDQVDATSVDDPTGQLGLCYNSDGFEPPKLISNFDGGDVELNDFNAWLAISDSVVCFAAAPSNMGIYGNLVQMNFLVGYDREGQTVSFKPTDCTHVNLEIEV